ncbi:MAG: hypothetical protein MI743_14605 [Sneathiellales bacterium]|nr:hypothetical protein [Sneathiellales bacterium]
MKEDLATFSATTPRQVVSLQKGLDALHASALRTEKAFIRLSSRPVLNQTLSDTKNAEGLFDQLLLKSDQLGKRLGTIFGKAFDQFVFGGKEAGDIVKSLEKDLVKLGNSTFSSSSTSLFQASKTAFPDFGSSLLASLFPGFANGGSFQVGGAAGRDQNLMAMRVSRGERVSIERPSEQQAIPEQRVGSNVKLSFNITTPDADSFRKSQSQIQTEAYRTVRRLYNRNG